MTEINTSAVFDVWEVLTSRIGNLSFPAVEGFDAPAVWFGDPAQPNPDENGNMVAAGPERVVVVSAVDRPAVEWGPVGNQAQEERFAVTVMVISQLPGKTSTEARDRIRDMAAIVAADVRAVQAGSRSGADQPTLFAGYPVWWFDTITTDPIIVPGDSGYRAMAEITIACRFRINSPARSTS